MKAPRKFRPGAPVRSLDELQAHAMQGRWFYCFGPRPQHWTVVFNQHLIGIIRMIDSGRLLLAEETPEWQAWAKAQP